MEHAGSLAPLLADNCVGEDIYALAAEIFPICRSITGNGVRRTIDVLSQACPDPAPRNPDREPPCSTGRCLGNGISRTRTSKMRKVTVFVDFHRSNLHVLNYSAPVTRRMAFSELKPHIFTLPDQPDLIPYRTSYYKETWGFCMSHRQLAELESSRR